MAVGEQIRRIHIRELGRGLTVAIARLLHHRGHAVTGMAPRRTPAVSRLEQLGVDIDFADTADEPPDADLIVHPHRGGAGESAPHFVDGTRMVDEGAILAGLTDEYRTIGVTGTHGRATVTSMIAWILEAGGHRPGFIISTRANNFGVEGRDTDDRWFVFELDERLISNRHIECDYVVCNYLDLVAPSYYGGVDNIVDGMRRFLEDNRRLKEAFVNLDCLGNRQLIEQTALRPTGYALEHRTEFRGKFVDESDEPVRFEAFHRDDRLDTFELPIRGRYNAVNALGAVAVATRLGISTETITDALHDYQGLENRYTIAVGAGVTVVKDFIRHPTAVGRLLRSARRDAEGQLVSIYAPSTELTGDETARQYASVLDRSDQVILVERDETTVDAEPLRDELARRRVRVDIIDDESKLVETIADSVSAGDELIFFGDDAFLKRADHVEAELVARAGQAPPEGEQQRFDSPLNEGDD